MAKKVEASIIFKNLLFSGSSNPLFPYGTKFQVFGSWSQITANSVRRTTMQKSLLIWNSTSSSLISQKCWMLTCRKKIKFRELVLPKITKISKTYHVS